MRAAAEVREKAGKMEEEQEEKETKGQSRDFYQLLCRDIGRYKVLSHEETIELIKQAQPIGIRNKEIDGQIEEMMAKNGRSIRIWRMLGLLMMQKRPNPAMQKIWAHNLRLVVSIARHFHHTNCFLLMEDLVLIGSEGLYETVLQFDISRGYKFSTYASWWIRHVILREIQDKNRTIRVPIHQQDIRRRLDNLERRMWIQGIEVDKDLPAPPSVIPPKADNGNGKENKTAKNFAVKSRRLKAKTIRELEKETFLVNRHPLTIDALHCLGSDEGLALQHILPDTKTSPPDARAELLGGLTDDFDSPQLAVIKMMELAGLTDREKKVIIKRFGIGAQEEMTLKQVGEECKLSREGIRQIEVRALNKLRCAAKKFSRPRNQSALR